MSRIIFGILLFGLVGCTTDYLKKDKGFEDIDGFEFDREAKIEDTSEHREVVGVLIEYRGALVSKDIGRLKRLISDEYYSNAGTTNTTADDYGAVDLPGVFELLSKHADEVKYDVVVKAVNVDGRKASVDYEYHYAYRYDVSGQASWDAGVDLNRLELVQREGAWKIVSGL